jgi:hypothetical protein
MLKEGHIGKIRKPKIPLPTNVRFWHVSLFLSLFFEGRILLGSGTSPLLEFIFLRKNFSLHLIKNALLDF